jgi:hypothetical protein
MYYRWAFQWHLYIIEVLPVSMGNMLSIDVATPKNECQQSVKKESTDCQQSVNRVSTIFVIASFKIRRLCYHMYPIIEVLCAVMRNTVSVNVVKPQLSINRTSTERPQCLVSYLVSCISCTRQFNHNPSIDYSDTQYG